jgi:hypothetical protein
MGAAASGSSTTAAVRPRVAENCDIHFDRRIQGTRALTRAPPVQH